jgi:hypothetical protein
MPLASTYLTQKQLEFSNGRFKIPIGTRLTLTVCRCAVSIAHEGCGGHQIVEPVIVLAFVIEPVGGTIVGAGAVAARCVGAEVQQ